MEFPNSLILQISNKLILTSFLLDIIAKVISIFLKCQMRNYLNSFTFSERMKIASIVGTRPNFMKIAPLANQFKEYGIEHILIHTGQHYDNEMSKLFFDDLQLPIPDINLCVGSDTRENQIEILVHSFLRNEEQ